MELFVPEKLFLHRVKQLCYIKWMIARKGQPQSCKTSEKFNHYINKQETKGSNNCVGECLWNWVVLIGTS